MTVQYPNGEVLFHGTEQECKEWVEARFVHTVYLCKVYQDRMVVEILFW